MIKNRRENAVSRTKVNDCKAFILQKKQRFQVKIVDRAIGGMGIIVRDEILKRLNLANNQVIMIQFILCKTNHTDSFIVCTINGNRIGLRYADGNKMSPRQRIIASHNM